MFVDVEPDTFNVDVAGIEAMVGPDTRAILMPNLAGNAPAMRRTGITFGPSPIATTSR